MNSTHEEFIKMPGGGHAFVTGVPDKCKHDDKETVYILANGDQLFESKCLCPTSEATQEYLAKICEDIHTSIVECTSGCSKCKKVHSLRDIMGDAFWD